MAIPQTSTILRHLRRTMLRYDGAGLSDGQLLRSYLYRRDEAAFEALVRRHGPMVRGVCRRILHNVDDADDAFQAVFLVLLRKASSLAMREILGDWLHGVAYRTSLKARAAAARRRLKEKQALRCEAVFDDENRSEWQLLLDEEIGRLPSKYRLPVVLCDLEGRTRKDAARQLGWPEGTVSGRLARARAMLARRLTRRGVTLTAAGLAVRLTGEASARLPYSLVGSISKAAMDFAAGSAAGSVPAHIVALTEGVVNAMFLSKLKNALALVAVALVLTAGVGAWRYVAVAAQTEKPAEEQSGSASHYVRLMPVPKPDVPKARTVVSGDRRLQTVPKYRRFQIDLRIEREKDGQRKLLATPQLLVSDVQQRASFALPDKFASGVPMDGIRDFAGMGPSVRITILGFIQDEICLDMTVNQPTRGAFGRGDTTVESKTIRVVRKLAVGEPTTVKLKTSEKEPTVLEVTAAVRVMEKETDPNTIAAAEKDLKMAEFWRRTGHPNSARFYYELIHRLYPDTIYDERAKERMTELKKPLDKREESKASQPPRVGQIFITGNKKISDEAILEQVKFYPGQILIHSDLRAAEIRLARLEGLKSNPKVTVIEGESEFKDICITVEEK